MNKTITDFKHLMIVDLEATCCDKKTIEREQMEIIEIGAVMVDRVSMEIKDEFQTFISPTINPTLTDFCKELTSIKQHDVNNAPDFMGAIIDFKHWMEEFDDFVFCSWGSYDKKQFKQDCNHHQVPYPMNDEHINIKDSFAYAQGIKRGIGMAKALKRAGLTLDGNHHRGIDDAKNMVKLLPWILGQRQLTM